MRTVIIDDERKSRDSIRNILMLLDPDIEISGEAEDVASGYELITSSKPQLVLLDINMPDGSGFDLLRKLGKIDFKLIFITAYEQFAINAFEFSAIDYLLKPIDPTKFKIALDKARDSFDKDQLEIKINALFSNISQVNNKTKKLVLSTSERIHIVETKDIVRCESESSYTSFYLVDQTRVVVSKNLKAFEELLKDCDFFRPHQSHLINLNFIDYYDRQDGGFIVMKSGDSIPISQRKREFFLKIISGFK